MAARLSEAIWPEIRGIFRVVVPEAGPLALALGAWAGALAYFGWPSQPPLAWGGVAVGFALVGLAVLPGLWRALAWGVAAAGVLWLLAGWEVARQQQVAFPWEAAATRSHWLVGQVAAQRPQADDPRRVTLELKPYHIFGLSPLDEAPATLRVGVWASQVTSVTVGTVVAAPVRFIPPDAPQMPGVRDSRLWQWFGATRASAYVTGRLEPTTDGVRYLVHQSNIYEDSIAIMERWRHQIVAESGALGQGVVAALLVGEQAQITASVREAYRTAGLSHLLAISGMQMTLVGLGLFALLRWLGACVPWLALRLNLKAWAAGGALGGMVAYTLLVGAAPAVVRAALMVALVLVAVLLGRVRGVLRAWAVASLLILVVQPHLAMSAGLQLSAVATLALAWWAVQAAPPRGVVGWAKATLVATVVAGAATAPIVALHFGAPAGVGVVANLIAIPLMTLASYAGFVALALWPLGAASLALAPMTWLVELTTAWAGWMAGWQVGNAPPLNGWAIGGLVLVAMLTLGMVLLRRWWWVLGLTCLSSAGLWAWGAWALRPSLIVAAGGESAWVAQPGPGANPRYRVAWAENPGQAAWLARVAKLPLVEQGRETPPCCADALMLPPTAENFAYAEYTVGQWAGQWRVQPMRCSRPWQQLAESCWGMAPAEEPEE